MVHPPIVQPRSGVGRPRKPFTDKQRSGQHIEAAEIRAKTSGHQFQALLIACGLMAHDENFGDLAFVLRRLAEDPIDLAKKLKDAITSPAREGTKNQTTAKLFKATIKHCTAAVLFIYKMSQSPISNFDEFFQMSTLTTFQVRLGSVDSIQSLSRIFLERSFHKKTK